jgi:hypothetical protein
MRQFPSRKLSHGKKSRQHPDRNLIHHKIWVPAASGIPLQGGPAIHNLSQPGALKVLISAFDG